ncbi:hypothetical protein A9Q97_01365 [Rhodospirillales bacterium 47_12_T64]|nr:hypothetical protein A9Q97_01365 [Rhodospirillales bacterium 47_12_T64]
MNKFERIVFVVGMSLVVFGLLVLFEDGKVYPGKFSTQQSAVVSSGPVSPVMKGPELPVYDIILFNKGKAGIDQLDLSLTKDQEEEIRLGLRQDGSEISCNLQGKRPDLVFWGQRAGLKHPDSMSVYSRERMIYLGNYLEAWKVQAQGGLLTCYTLNEKTTKLLMSL